ncbi:MAG: hypothetical protein IKR76_11385, partial [Ruminococcus sp.]|nr:hypothetical protein [Ruminococcus sp.]
KKKKKSDSSSVSSSVIDESSSDDDSSSDDSSDADSSSEDVIPGSVTEPVVDSEPEKTTTNTTTTKKVADDSEPDEYPIDNPPDIDDPSQTTTTTTKKAVSLPADEIGDEIKPVQLFFDGIQDGDIKKVEESFSPQIMKYLKDKGLWDGAEETLTEEYKKVFGDDYKIDVIYTGKRKLTDKETDSFIKEFEHDFGEKPDTKELYDIEIRATIKGSKDSDSEDSHVIVGNSGSKWYVFEI